MNEGAKYEAMLKLSAEMVLSKALIKWKLEKLLRNIDSALDTGDKEAFIVYSEEFRRLKDATV
jgi:uncharacterized protein YpiB (UPF0302 family)